MGRSNGIRLRSAILGPLLAVASALPLPAAAGGVPEEPPEGSRGAGRVVWSPDGRSLAVGRWDGATLSIVDAAGGGSRLLSPERGAGAAPAWTADGALLFKEVFSQRGQRRQRLVRQSVDGGRTVLAEGPLLGDPVVAGDLVIHTSGCDLVVSKAGAERRLPLHGYVNRVAVDPAGRRVGFVDAGGRVGVIELESSAVSWLVEPGAHHCPAWSPDGSLLLVRGPGAAFFVLEAGTGTVRLSLDGIDPVWTPDGSAVLFSRIESLGAEILAADLHVVEIGSGRVRRLALPSPVRPRFPAPSPDGRRLALVDIATGDLLIAPLGSGFAPGPLTAVAAAGDLPPSPPPLPPPARDVEVWVPFMHQRWDTPDDFNGNWSCGPTSCLQTVQRYAVLPDLGTTCSQPYPHACPWASYIPEVYTYGAHTYDIWGLAAGSNWVQGAHGFICRELGAAYWAHMVTYMNQHGLESWQAGTSFSTLTQEVDTGFPMVASTTVLGYGHIIVMKGYGNDHSVIVNDPYGDANSGNWGNNYLGGDGAVYDWPGYNNGNLQITVKQLFGARGEGGPEPEPADCEPVALLTCGAEVTTSNNAEGSTTGNFFYGCPGGWTYSGPEMAFRFVTDLDETVVLSLTGLEADLDLFVVESTACDGDDCIEESTNSGTNDEELSFEAAAGVEVIVVVDGWQGAVSGFTLAIECEGTIPEEEEPDAGPDADTDTDADADADTDTDTDTDADTDSTESPSNDGGGCGCRATGKVPASGLLTVLRELRG